MNSIDKINIKKGDIKVIKNINSIFFLFVNFLYLSNISFIQLFSFLINWTKDSIKIDIQNILKINIIFINKEKKFNIL